MKRKAEATMSENMQDAFSADMSSAATSSANASAMPFCKSRALLERYGLRATRQRLGLARLLFSKGDRHVTADTLAAEAYAARMPASLATVYNVLNLFAQVGLVRGFAIEGNKTVFDTNTTDHCHFYFEESGDISDLAVEGKSLIGNIQPPEGYEVAKVDVVVRLRRKA